MMLHPRASASSRATVLIGVLAIAVLAPQNSATADPTRQHEVHEVNCEGFVIQVEVPPENVEPLVPAPFEANPRVPFADGLPVEALKTIRLDVVMEKCERFIIGDNHYEDVVFTHALVDLKKWPVEKDEEPAEPVDPRKLVQYQFWLAVNNAGVVDYFRERGGPDVRLVPGLTYTQNRNFVSFEAPEPTPWPFRATATLGPRAAIVDVGHHLFRAVPKGFQYVEVSHTIKFGALTDWTIRPERGSLLDDVLCNSPRSFDEDVTNVGLTFEETDGFFTAEHYPADVEKVEQVPKCQQTD